MKDRPEKSPDEERQYRLAAMRELYWLTIEARGESFPYDWDHIERDLFEKLAKR